MADIKPQEGFQQAVLETEADIAFIGGAAGAGKTFVELLEGTRHVANPDFGFMIFRRTTPQIRNVGGLWDTSMKLYPLLGAKPTASTLTWRFPSGAVAKFSHLEHDKDVLDYQGAQIPLIIFDELTHFTENQFWYMVSRNRSMCGVKPYIRASMNPDPNSWVAKIIEWYIDPVSGFPIPERCGKIRYFSRDGDTLIWGNTRQEVVDQAPHIFADKDLVESGIDVKDLVKSFTFIPGTIYENKLFIKEDPGYLGNLLSMSTEEKARLLSGNWLISLDGLQLCDHYALNNIFTNYPEQSRTALRCITVDAARFGRDFCVIMYWEGWEMKHMVVMKISDSHDIVAQIEKLRQKFSVMRDNVVVDQDGVGDGTVKLGNYAGFHGGGTPVKDPTSRIKEDYKNYKTQCYYRFCQMRINTGQVRFSINSENCHIFDGTYEKGIFTTKIKIGSKIWDVRDLIIADFRSVKRKETPNLGVDKIQMIDKEEQKVILGRSPDFGDCAMMREYFELRYSLKSMTRAN